MYVTFFFYFLTFIFVDYFKVFKFTHLRNMYWSCMINNYLYMRGTNDQVPKLYGNIVWRTINRIIN